MNFQNLDYFVTTATVKSFTKAASRLYVTQQTLSGQIASLEKEIGYKLFIRSKPLELTKAGEIFFSYAMGLLRDYRKMQAELTHLDERMDNTVSIGIPYPGAIQRFTKLMMSTSRNMLIPQIRFVEMPGDDLIEGLRKGSLDLAIAHFPENDPAFVCQPMFEDEVVLLATDELLQNTFGGAAEAIIREIHATGNFSLLKSCPYIRSKCNNIVAHFADRFMKENIPAPIINAEADSFDAQIWICRSGAAFSFFPRRITSDALNRQDLFPFHVFTLGESARFTVHYGYRKGTPRGPALEDFVQRVVTARVEPDAAGK
ncbi:MAG: LysR family transcriptional regulator [Lachnospiraceae bacterium]|nr:LysR family transcriptional regulator [Lachnospiraceae bacterium]